jgi:hypothetical protein
MTKSRPTSVSTRRVAAAPHGEWLPPGIPVENIDHVLLVAGGDDQVWPALSMSESIKARRAAHGLETTLVSDPEAGHRTVLPGEPNIVAP